MNNAVLELHTVECLFGVNLIGQNQNVIMRICIQFTVYFFIHWAVCLCEYIFTHTEKCTCKKEIFL